MTVLQHSRVTGPLLRGCRQPGRTTGINSENKPSTDILSSNRIRRCLVYVSFSRRACGVKQYASSKMSVITWPHCSRQFYFRMFASDCNYYFRVTVTYCRYFRVTGSYRIYTGMPRTKRRSVQCSTDPVSVVSTRTGVTPCGKETQRD